STYNSALFNFVIDTDATSGELAAIRWYEFRQTGDGQPWSIYQEGTYSAPDGRHAWHASMIMDNLGNIGMGYTSMSGPTTPTTEFVSSYYTGRFAADPLNTMTIAEELIANGNANIPGTRYGDYSKIDLDPNDDQTMWFINEYMNSGRKDVVGVFKVAPNFNNDVGVAVIDEPETGTLSATETVTITIFNYGLNDQSNFDVSFQVDGGAVVTETFTGTISAATSAQYTFTATADLSTVGQTYTITAATDLAGDEEPSNDSTMKDVTYLQPNDIGVSAITAPVSGTGLTATEDITVEITNFGGEPQSNFDVTYTLDGDPPVTEVVPGPLAGNSTLLHTFAQTGDFSQIGSYNLSATTSLPGDSDTSNDATAVVIIKSNCEPALNCTLGDGIYLFEVTDLTNPSGCDGGYSNFTNLTATFPEDSTNDLTITTNYGDQFVRVWIDYNDDFTFSLDELVVDNYEIADGQNTGTFTDTMPLVIPPTATPGMHIMRAKTNWNAPVPDDACEVTTYGETEDYSAIVGALGIGDNALNANSLTVVRTDKNIFDVTLNTDQIEDKLEITVFNIMGQRLLYYKMKPENGAFNYNLDLSYVASGVYLVRVGNSQNGLVQRVVVE
ncbi:MAG: GEVED domain-containing protein, partial [Marinirhabdus sp.]